jgi:hypothetical protein
LLYQWRSAGTGGASNRIVITTGQVASLAASFERTWMRAPTDAELKALVDEFIRLMPTELE